MKEWGVGESNGNGVFDVQKSDKWLNWMEQHKLKRNDSLAFTRCVGIRTMAIHNAYLSWNLYRRAAH